MEELRIFFWGIFKDKEMIERRIGIVPNDFLDATFIGQDGTIKLILKGKLAIWKNLPSEVYYQILGKLALVEKDFYVLSKGFAIVNGERHVCYVYYPAERDLYRMITEPKGEGSLEKIELE